MHGHKCYYKNRNDFYQIEVLDETGMWFQVANIAADLNEDTAEPPAMEWTGTSALKISFQSNAVDTGRGFFATVSSGAFR